MEFEGLRSFACSNTGGRAQKFLFALDFQNSSTSKRIKMDVRNLEKQTERAREFHVIPFVLETIKDGLSPMNGKQKKGHQIVLDLYEYCISIASRAFKIMKANLFIQSTTLE